MSKIKIVIWLIILGLITTLFFQNDTLFLSKQALSFDLYFLKYQTPELPVAVYFLTVLIIGLFVAYLSSLSDRFKARRKIKTLTTGLDSQRQEVVSLKKEIEELKIADRPAPTIESSVSPPPKAAVVPPVEPESAPKVEVSPPSVESDTEKKSLSLNMGEENKEEPEKIELNNKEEKH